MHIANDRVVYMVGLFISATIFSTISPLQSCSNAGCSRKVTKLSSGLYRCDKCEKDSSVHQWSYMLRVSDSTRFIPWTTTSFSLG